MTASRNVDRYERLVAKYDPMRSEVIDNPYPYYEALRTVRPVHFVADYGYWAVSRYRDCARILENAEGAFTSTRGIGLRDEDGPIIMAHDDPPAHTRLRRLTEPAFADFVKRRRSAVEALVVELTSKVLDVQRVEFVQAFAEPLPVTVIADVLGVPPSDRPLFKRWAQARLQEIADPKPETSEASDRATSEFHSYMSAALDERRNVPRDDLLSRLLHGETESGDRLSGTELISLSRSFLTAGHETTTNLLSNMILMLSRHPDVLPSVADRPSLAARVVDETLRLEAPVQGLFRSTTRPVDLDASKIPAGTKVQMLFAAANRDGAAFDEPDTFDPYVRRDLQHLSFGKGPHHCIGAGLARVEAIAVLKALAERTRGVEIHSFEWRPSMMMRGPRRLEVTFETSRPGL